MGWKEFLPGKFKTRRSHLRYLYGKLEAVDADYDPKLEALREGKGSHSEEYQQLLSEADFMGSEYMDEIQAIETKDLLADAHHYFVDLADIPPPPDGGSHWEEGNFGHRFLTSAASNALRKLVYKTRREHAKEWREKGAFWFGILAGVVGLCLTVYNTFVNNRKLSDLSNRVTAVERANSLPARKP